MAERDEATLEKEQGKGAFQPGFGRKHLRKHQKAKAFIAATTGKAIVLGKHWRIQQVVLKLVLRVNPTPPATQVPAGQDLVETHLCV